MLPFSKVVGHQFGFSKRDKMNQLLILIQYEADDDSHTGLYPVQCFTEDRNTYINVLQYMQMKVEKNSVCLYT